MKKIAVHIDTSVNGSELTDSSYTDWDNLIMSKHKQKRERKREKILKELHHQQQPQLQSRATLRRPRCVAPVESDEYDDDIANIIAKFRHQEHKFKTKTTPNRRLTVSSNFDPSTVSSNFDPSTISSEPFDYLGYIDTHPKTATANDHATKTKTTTTKKSRNRRMSNASSTQSKWTSAMERYQSSRTLCSQGDEDEPVDNPEEEEEDVEVEVEVTIHKPSIHRSTKKNTDKIGSNYHEQLNVKGYRPSKNLRRCTVGDVPIPLQRRSEAGKTVCTLQFEDSTSTFSFTLDDDGSVSSLESLSSCIL